MKCPFCQSDNLREFEEDTLSDATTITSNCCEDCGGSFAIIQEPQEILLQDIKGGEETE